MTAPGFQIEPISAEANFGKGPVQKAAPGENYFPFRPDAAYFRLFFLRRVSDADHDIAVIGARTLDELERQTARFEQNPTTCAAEPQGACILIPKEVAVLPHIAVSINGKITPVWIGATVQDAIRLAGVRDTKAALPALTVERMYRGRLVPVHFDRTQEAIFRLSLIAGDDVRW